MTRTFALTLALALTSMPVWAAPEDDAKDLFARGRELRTKGDCAGAIPLFAKAWQLYPKGLGSLRNLAECNEHLGKYASARRAWLDLSRALLTVKDAKYAGWSEDAQAADARLAPKVARLTVVVHESGKGVALSVLVNGEVLDPKLLDIALDRDPGTYVVRVEGGKEPVEKSVSVASGEAKTVTLDVEHPTTATTTVTTPKPEPKPILPEQPATTSGTRTAGFVTLGVGGGALAVAGIALVVRQKALGDLKDACPYYESKPCPTSTESIVDRGKTASTLVTVFSVIGAVGIGTGVTLLVMGSSDSPKTGMALSPWAGPSGGGATLQGSF